MNHRFAKLIILMAIFAFAGFCPAPGGAGPWAAAAGIGVITVTVDGSPIAFPDQAPYLDENNRTLVPIRFPMEAMGVIVAWDAAAQSATLTRGGTSAVFTVGSPSYTVNGQARSMDTVPVLTHDRTVFPIRFAAEAFGATVSWDEPGQTVRIVTAGSSVPAGSHVVKFTTEDGSWGYIKSKKVYFIVCINNDAMNTCNLNNPWFGWYTADLQTSPTYEITWWKDSEHDYVRDGKQPFGCKTVAGMKLEYNVYEVNSDNTRGNLVDHFSFTLGNDHLD